MYFHITLYSGPQKFKFQPKWDYDIFIFLIDNNVNNYNIEIKSKKNMPQLVTYLECVHLAFRRSIIKFNIKQLSKSLFFFISFRLMLEILCYLPGTIFIYIYFLFLGFILEYYFVNKKEIYASLTKKICFINKNKTYFFSFLMFSRIWGIVIRVIFICLLAYFNIVNIEFIFFSTSSLSFYIHQPNLIWDGFNSMNKLPDFASNLRDKMKSITSPGSGGPKGPYGDDPHVYSICKEAITRRNKGMGPSGDDDQAIVSAMDESKKLNKEFKVKNPDFNNNIHPFVEEVPSSPNKVRRNSFFSRQSTGS